MLQLLPLWGVPSLLSSPFSPFSPSMTFRTMIMPEVRARLELLFEGVACAEDMIPRLRTLDDEEVLFALCARIREEGVALPGYWDGVYEEIHRSAPGISARIVRAALNDRASAAIALLENPALTPPLVEVLAYESMGRLEEGMREFSVKGQIALLLLKGIYSKGLLQRQHPITERIWGLARKMTPVDGASAYGMSSASMEERYRQGLMMIFACCQDAGKDELREIAGRIGDHTPASETVEQVTLHPNTDEGVWRKLLERSSGFEERMMLLLLLARRKDARTNVQVRAAMLRMRSEPPVLAALCLDAGSKTRKLFGDLVRISPMTAIEVLENPSFEGRDLLLAEDGLLLLTHENSEVRLGAIRAWKGAIASETESVLLEEREVRGTKRTLR